MRHVGIFGFFPKQVPKTKELESEKTVRESCVTRKNVKTRNVLLPFETQCQRGKIQQSTPWVLHQSSTESFPCDHKSMNGDVRLHVLYLLPILEDKNSRRKR